MNALSGEFRRPGGASPPDGNRRHALGARGEEAARRLALAKGLRPLAANHRTPYGELDLVLEDRSGRVIFAEVKTRAGGRTSIEDGLLAVDRRRQERLRQAALAFCEETGRGEPAMRFDVFAVADPGDGGELRIVHVEDAF